MPNDLPDWLNSADVLTSVLFNAGFAAAAVQDFDVSALESIILSMAPVPGTAVTLELEQHADFPISGSFPLDVVTLTNDANLDDFPNFRLAMFGKGLRIRNSSVGAWSGVTILGSTRRLTSRLDSNIEDAQSTLFTVTATANGFFNLVQSQGGHLAGPVWCDFECVASGAGTASLVLTNNGNTVNLIRGAEMLTTGTSKFFGRMVALPVDAYHLRIFVSGFAANFVANARFIRAGIT